MCLSNVTQFCKRKSPFRWMWHRGEQVGFFFCVSVVYGCHLSLKFKTCQMGDPLWLDCIWYCWSIDFDNLVLLAKINKLLEEKKHPDAWPLVKWTMRFVKLLSIICKGFWTFEEPFVLPKDFYAKKIET